MRKTYDSPHLYGSLRKYDFAQADSVWSIDGISPTLLAYNAGGIGHQINIWDDRRGEEEWEK